MKKLVIFLILLCPGSILAGNKLDPYFNISGKMDDSFYKTMSSDQGLIPTIIQTKSPKITRIFISDNGGIIHTTTKNIITADISKDIVQEISERPEVVYIEAAKSLTLNLDESGVSIGAPSVHAGMANNTPYTGKGVIVGIIDSGIDWAHSVFNDDNGNSRIISIWDQTVGSSEGFSAPNDIENSYGIECLNSQIEEGNCPSYDFAGHGTHIAGIVAGRHDRYNGIAPDSELIIVKVTEKFDFAEYAPSLDYWGALSNRIIDAANYIFTKAGSLGKPAVINISLGMHFGAHDGTSLLEEALNDFLDDLGGRSIVGSAGNKNRQSEGYFASIHAGAALTDETKAVEFHGLASHVHGLILDIWQSSDSNISFGIGVDNYDTYEDTGLVASGDIFDAITDDGKLRVVIDSSETNNPLNGKKHTVVNITAVEGDAGAEISTDNYVFDLIATGNGRFDAWVVDGGALFAKRVGNYKATGYTYFAGDSKFTVGIPSTAKNVISVGSYASRSDFFFLDSSLFPDDFDFTEIGEISPFSSYGPSIAPEQTGQKPEITAPGEWVISALSSQAVNTAIQAGLPIELDGTKFAAMDGTSMAAPHVAGSVALLFERNPELSVNQIKMFLEKNTTDDEFTVTLPNNQWGYGKLNVLKTMQNFDTTDLNTPLPLAQDEVQETAFQPYLSNGDAGGLSEEGKSGCSVSGATKINVWPFLLPLLFIIGKFVFRRKFLGVLILTVFLCSCGSSGDDDSILQLSESGTLNLGSESLEIDTEKMMAVYTSHNDNGDNEEIIDLVQLYIPLKHFFAGEEIEIGFDNAFSANNDQAFFSVHEYRKEQKATTCPAWVSCEPDYVPVSTWVAVSGRLKLDKAYVSNLNTVGSLEDVKLRKLDLETMTIDRDGEETAFAGAIDAGVSTNVSEPIITEIYPLTASLGSKVTIKGFNLYGKVSFENCGHYFPFESISANQIEVTIDEYCTNTRLQVDNGYGTDKGYALEMDEQ